MRVNITIKNLKMKTAQRIISHCKRYDLIDGPEDIEIEELEQ